MWYGSKTKLNATLLHRRNLLYLNWRNKKDGNYFNPRRSLPSNNSILTIPSPWNFVLLRNQNRYSNLPLIYAYNANYFFTFTIPASTYWFRLDSGSKSIFMSKRFYDYLFTHHTSSFRHILRMLNSFFFTKMTFKGKGYYIYKNFRNTIAPKFGYYHRIYVYAYNVTVKFLSKRSVLLFGFSKQDVMSVGHDFKSKKPINIFTGRGVRFARQIVYRKTGKVSSYR